MTTTTHRRRTAGGLARGVTALALGGALLPVHAAPAHADPETPEHVYFVAEATSCFVAPDASGQTASTRPVVGRTYRASAPKFSGTGIGGGDEVFRWIEPTSGGPGCYVPASFTSTDTGNLDQDDFTAKAIVDTTDQSTALGGVLARHALAVFAAPSFASNELVTTKDGDVLTVSGREVTGQITMVGPQKFMAVNVQGQMGWILTSSIQVLPTVDPATLTREITLEHDVTAWSHPGNGADEVDSYGKGDKVMTGEPFNGFVPVAAEDEEGNATVAWLSQAEMLGQSEQPSPTAQPSPSGEESPGWVDKIKDKWEEKTEAAKDKVAQVKADRQRALDAARLRIAGLAALLTVALALFGHAWTKRVGNGFSMRDLVADVQSGGLLPLLRHAAIPAGLVAGVIAGNLAPTANYLAYSLAGGAIVGLLVGAAAAFRVAKHLGRDISGLTAVSMQWVGATAVVGVGAGHYIVDRPWTSALVIGLAAAGVVAGVVAPKAGVGEEPQPVVEAHPEIDEAA